MKFKCIFDKGAKKAQSTEFSVGCAFFYPDRYSGMDYLSYTVFIQLILLTWSLSSNINL